MNYLLSVRFRSIGPQTPKIAALASRKDEPDLRHQISCQIQHELSQGHHEGLTLDGFRKLVNQRLAWIRAVARQHE